MLEITDTLSIPAGEVHVRAVRSQGPGGQNVNKVASAAELRFDVRASSLPAHVQERLMSSGDRRVTADGVVRIKAQRYRTWEANRRDAIDRLRALVAHAAAPRAARRPTTPTPASEVRRRETKVKRARVKSLRGRVDEG